MSRSNRLQYLWQHAHAESFVHGSIHLNTLELRIVCERLPSQRALGIGATLGLHALADTVLALVKVVECHERAAEHHRAASGSVEEREAQVSERGLQT